MATLVCPVTADSPHRPSTPAPLGAIRTIQARMQSSEMRGKLHSHEVYSWISLRCIQATYRPGVSIVVAGSGLRLVPFEADLIIPNVVFSWRAFPFAAISSSTVRPAHSRLPDGRIADPYPIAVCLL